MAKQIKNVDLYQKDIFANFIKSSKDASVSTEELNKQLILLNQEFTSLGKDAKKQLANIKIDKPTIESFEKLAKVELAVTEGKKELIKMTSAEYREFIKTQKVQKKEIKIKKTSIKLSDEELKEKIKLQKVNAQRKKDLEAELILEQKSIKNRNELRETIKALRIEANKLDIGSDALKAANDEIDELDAKLKDVSDNFVQNKINIGNYKDATIDLTNSLDDQKKKLKILEEAYKDQVSIGKKNTKETKQLKKEYRKQAKEVKNLEGAVEDLGEQAEDTGDKMSKLAKGTGILALIAFAFATLKDLFGSSRSASLELNLAMANLTETVSVFFKSALKAWGGLKIISEH